jgi:hypothetical protein
MGGHHESLKESKSHYEPSKPSPREPVFVLYNHFALCILSSISKLQSLCLIVSFYIYKTSILSFNYSVILIYTVLYNCYRPIGWFYCFFYIIFIIFIICIIFCTVFIIYIYIYIYTNFPLQFDMGYMTIY